MTDAVLTAGKTHHLIGADALHTETAFIVVTHGIEQLGQVAKTVFPVFVVLCRVDQRLLNVGRRGKVRGAHTQIKQMAAFGFQSYLFVVERGKDLRSEQVQPVGKFHAKNLVSKMGIFLIIRLPPPPCKPCRFVL